MVHISMGSNNENDFGKALNTCVCALTLRTPDGREQRMAALVPNDRVRRHYISKAHKAGLEIEITNIDNKQ